MLPDEFRKRLDESRARGAREVEAVYLRKLDPFGLGALKVLIEPISRRAHGLSGRARVATAEYMRDATDRVERGLEN